MRITKLPLLLLFLAALLSACDDDDFCIRGEGDTETRTLSLADFNGVSVNGSTEVYIRRGEVQQVEVKGQSNVLDELETEVSGGVWNIEFDRCIRRHRTVEVYITVPELTSAEVNGSGFVELEDVFEVEEFFTRITGSGEIRARVAAEEVTSRISGSGSVRLAGTASVQDVSISGSGNHEAFDLRTNATSVTISGSGKAEVTVADELNVEISGSGRVYYRGNPTINSNISGSGRLIKS